MLILSGYGAFVMGPKALAQESLKHLAGATFRQFGLRKFDAARHF
jgi:hypothetical protein